MKVLLLSLGVLCAITCTVQAYQSHTFPPSTGPTFPRPPNTHRFRREPQGSISLEAIKPLGDRNRHSSVDLNYNQRLIDNPKTTLDTFGGANFDHGHTSPHAGLKFEHNFNKDMFVRGHGQLQPGPRGGVSPSFGADFGYRFRREAAPAAQSHGFPPRSTGPTFPRPPFTHRFRREPQGSVSLEAMEPLSDFGHRFRREAAPAAQSHGFPPRSTGPTFPRPPFTHRFRREPQGSISLEAMKPLSGTDRHTSVDLNYNHRIIDNPKTTLDAFGGANFRQGHTSPHGGLKFEHNFNKDMFINGHGQMQPGPRGGLSPSFGAGFGYRFRREALPYEEEEIPEEVY